MQFQIDTARYKEHIKTIGFKVVSNERASDRHSEDKTLSQEPSCKSQLPYREWFGWYQAIGDGLCCVFCVEFFCWGVVVLTSSFSELTRTLFSVTLPRGMSA